MSTEETTPRERDRVLRAMTDDGSFRVVAARTTDTVAGVLAAQGAAGETGRNLGELVTAAVLYRETMAPTLRVQTILQGAGGRGGLVADSHPDGWARGLVNLPEGVSGVRLGAGAMLQMMRTLPNGELHRGVVEAPVEGGLSGAMMAYLQLSEQVASVVAMGCVLEGERVVAAGGYLVQLLPEAPDHEAAFAVMTERLAHFDAIETILPGTDASPDHLVSELFYGMEHTLLGDSELRFGCNCSQVRVIGSLATLGRADIEDLMRDGSPLEIGCDYCGASYAVEPEQLRGLLASS